MKAKLFMAAAAIAILSGCANQLSRYADSNLPLAEQGRLKWSEYYSGLYIAAQQSSLADRARVMGRANVMIEASRAYEEGRISKDQFQHLRRQVQTAQAADDDAASERARLALLAAGKSISDASATATSYKVVQPRKPTTTDTTCNSFGGQVNCTSTSY